VTLHDTVQNVQVCLNSNCSAVKELLQHLTDNSWLPLDLWLSLGHSNAYCTCSNWSAFCSTANKGWICTQVIVPLMPWCRICCCLFTCCHCPPLPVHWGAWTSQICLLMDRSQLQDWKERLLVIAFDDILHDYPCALFWLLSAPSATDTGSCTAAITCNRLRLVHPAMWALLWSIWDWLTQPAWV